MLKKTKASETSSLFLVSSKDFFAEAVQSGLQKRNLRVYPGVERYLVGILEHYLDARNLFQNEISESGQKKPDTLAEMLLVAVNSDHKEKTELLKQLGDRSLYISGFFGDSLKRKIVDVDYYAEMGGTAYAALADCVAEDTTAQIYRTFSKQFIDFVDVLTYISETSSIKTDQDLLRLYDRYMRTGSELAKEKLVELGVLTVPRDQAKLARQD
jgi:hypothetical protein